MYIDGVTLHSRYVQRYDDLHIKRELAKGSYGIVFEASDIDDSSTSLILFYLYCFFFLGGGGG